MAARVIVGVVAAVGIGLTAACGSVPGSTDDELRIAGSDTMLVLNRRLAEGYMRAHPGVVIRVKGGGTASGVEALVAGEVAVCAASRPLTAAEVQWMHDRHNTLGVRFPIAQDALSVWLHPENPVASLTVAQLGSIFTGTVANWKEVDGEDREIVVVVRPPASGTYRLFRDRVLAGLSYRTDAVTAVTTNQVLETVAAEPAAIGYGGVAYTRPGVRTCAVDGVPPSAEALAGGDYPLARHLTLVTVAPPRGLARSFIDWCQGSSGQALVAEVGYLPLWRRP
jgi:phosphate transport system substrate-binding protein